MAEIIKEQYSDGKYLWVFKQDSYNQKWILYKDNKKIKSHQNWIEVAKEVPDYAKKFK